MSTEHKELVARATARWNARKDKQRKQGRSPEQRAKTERNRGTDHASQIKAYLSKKPGEWVKQGTITKDIPGNLAVLKSALDSMVSAGNLETKTQGKSNLYRLAS